MVLIYCNLPALSNPLTDLFAEALGAAPYSMRDTQIAELRDLIRDPAQKIQVKHMPGYDFKPYYAMPCSALLCYAVI